VSTRTCAALARTSTPSRSVSAVSRVPMQAGSSAADSKHSIVEPGRPLRCQLQHSLWMLADAGQESIVGIGCRDGQQSSRGGLG
jgi:hypothetical protein